MEDLTEALSAVGAADAVVLNQVRLGLSKNCHTEQTELE